MSILVLDVMHICKSKIYVWVSLAFARLAFLSLQLDASGFAILDSVPSNHRVLTTIAYLDCVIHEELSSQLVVMQPADDVGILIVAPSVSTLTLWAITVSYSQNPGCRTQLVLMN